MKMTNRAVCLSLPILILCACAVENIKPKMTNASPESEIQEIKSFEVIPATVSVTGNEDIFIGDVNARLNSEKIFKSISESSDLKLHVNYEAKSDQYDNEDNAKSMLNELAVWITGEDALDRYYYSVILKAELKHGDRIISEYDAVGSYYGEIPEASSLSNKIDRTNQAVVNSHEHAMALLMAKLKQDRNRIIGFIN